jgi:hypothetical protein
MTNNTYTDVEVTDPLVKLCSSEWSLGITSIQRLAGYWQISGCPLDGLRCFPVNGKL